MKLKTSRLWIALTIVFLTITYAFYYTSHQEITDAHALISKTIDASKDIKSYKFAISTNLSIHGKNIQMISGRGYVDYRNKKLRITMTMMNNSMEMIVIDDTAYIRESNGPWQTQKLSEHSIWKSSYDPLLQQRSILLNASNVTMRKEENDWILEIVPDKKVVIEQMKRTSVGLETIKKEKLKNFTIRYWIEKDSYHIKRIENNVELEMNIKGLETPVRLNNLIEIYDYNEKVKIEAPVD